MQTDISEVEINGTKYVRKDAACVQPLDKDAVIIRSESAGVFFGNILETNLGEGWVKMKNARRLWYWSGAASLSQLAVDGTTKPKECKFPTAVPQLTVMKVIEIIPCTPKAVESLTGVAVWKV